MKITDKINEYIKVYKVRRLMIYAEARLRDNAKQVAKVIYPYGTKWFSTHEAYARLQHMRKNGYEHMAELHEAKAKLYRELAAIADTNQILQN